SRPRAASPQDGPARRAQRAATTARPHRRRTRRRARNERDDRTAAEAHRRDGAPRPERTPHGRDRRPAWSTDPLPITPRTDGQDATAKTTNEEDDGASEASWPERR